MVSAFHQIEAVLLAVGITLFVAIGVSLFAMQTKFDFTKSCFIVVLIVLLSLAGMGIGIAIFWSYNKHLQGIYGGIGAVLMAIFLAIDTQMLIGNKKHKFDAEDYINAALSLYLDISNLFMFILQLVSAVKN
jgi:FtsH-binding integral membrane protein